MQQVDVEGHGCRLPVNVVEEAQAGLSSELAGGAEEAGRVPMVHAVALNVDVEAVWTTDNTL